VRDTGVSRPPSAVKLTFALGLILAIWSFNYIFAKTAFRELPPLAVASFRIVVAALSMVPVFFFLLITERPNPKDGALAEGSAGAIVDAWRFAYLGFFGMVVNHVGFTVGLNYTSVSHSSVIVGATTIVVMVLAWMMGLEQITGRKLAGLGLAFAGAIVLGIERGSNGGSTGLLGDLLTLGGVVGFSLYTVLGKRVAERYSAVRMTVYNSFWAGLLILPVAYWQAAKIHETVGLRSISWQGWAAVAYMGAVASAGAFLLYFWALRYMSASKLSSLNYLQPVGATLLAALLIGEKVTFNFIIGGVLILMGVYVIEARAAGR
jgi:drug/metabolite transporter (DMT)-like permease